MSKRETAPQKPEEITGELPLDVMFRELMQRNMPALIESDPELWYVLRNAFFCGAMSYSRLPHVLHREADREIDSYPKRAMQRFEGVAKRRVREIEQEVPRPDAGGGNTQSAPCMNCGEPFGTNRACPACNMPHQADERPVGSELLPEATLAHLSRLAVGNNDIRLLLISAAELLEERDELQHIFDMQHARSKEADQLWRDAHPGNENVIPDLGRLLEWLMSQMPQKGPND